jgi:hypothetical protein
MSTTLAVELMQFMDVGDIRRDLGCGSRNREYTLRRVQVTRRPD